MEGGGKQGEEFGGEVGREVGDVGGRGGGGEEREDVGGKEVGEEGEVGGWGGVGGEGVGGFAGHGWIGRKGQWIARFGINEAGSTW